MADVLRIPSAQHAEWLGGVLGGPGGFACWCRVCFFELVHLHGMRVWCAWMSMRVGLASQGSCELVPVFVHLSLRHRRCDLLPSCAAIRRAPPKPYRS